MSIDVEGSRRLLVASVATKAPGEASPLSFDASLRRAGVSFKQRLQCVKTRAVVRGAQVLSQPFPRH